MSANRNTERQARGQKRASTPTQVLLRRSSRPRVSEDSARGNPLNENSSTQTSNPEGDEDGNNEQSVQRDQSANNNVGNSNLSFSTQSSITETLRILAAGGGQRDLLSLMSLMPEETRKTVMKELNDRCRVDDLRPWIAWQRLRVS